MAQFNIHDQHAHTIQQADVINGATPSWDEMSEQIRALKQDIDDLIAAGSLERRTADELCAAVSGAGAATEKKSRLRELTKASNIAAGVSILSGISQTIAQILRMMT